MVLENDDRFSKLDLMMTQRLYIATLLFWVNRRINKIMDTFCSLTVLGGNEEKRRRKRVEKVLYSKMLNNLIKAKKKGKKRVKKGPRKSAHASRMEWALMEKVTLFGGEGSSTFSKLEQAWTPDKQRGENDQNEFLDD